MKIFRSFQDAKAIINPVVTTGSFDGVHLGHKTILNRLKKLAEINAGESVLITFDPHPRKVLYPDTDGKNLKLINSQEEKLELLREAGLDNIIIIEFTREFSKITSEQFVRNFLHDMLHAKVVVAGFNHHFGFNKEGDYKQLWGWQTIYNFIAEEIPEQDVYNETVSSTKIRQALHEGYIQRANAYLDHYYIITGRIESFENKGPLKLPGFVKIPVKEESKLLPSPGIYAASVVYGDHYSKGMVLINSIQDGADEVFLSIFDYSGFTDNSNITISFHKRMHGAVNLYDSLTFPKIKTVKEAISELIY
jgi:riboflavin kinase/FMN adenylyltransferase